MDRRAFLALAALGAAAPSSVLASSGEGEKKKKVAGSNYVPIDTISASTNKPGGKRGVFSVNCGLDIPDEKLREKAQLILPRIRAAYVQTVQVYAAGLAPSSLPNVDFLAFTMQRQTDTMLGKKGAKLLMGAVVVS